MLLFTVFFLLSSQLANAVPILPAGGVQLPSVTVKQTGGATPDMAAGGEPERPAKVQYSVPDEEQLGYDSEDLQKLSQRYSMGRNAMGVVPDKEDGSQKFLSKEDVQRLEEEERLRAEGKKPKHEHEGDLQEGHQGPGLPGHHQDDEKDNNDSAKDHHHDGELRNDQAGPRPAEHHQDETGGSKTQEEEGAEEPSSEEEAPPHVHDDIDESQSGPRMPERHQEDKHVPEGPKEHIHGHRKEGSSGPGLPAHEVDDKEHDSERGGKQRMMHSRRPTPANATEEEVDQIAETMLLQKQLEALEVDGDSHESIETFLQQKLTDENARTFVKTRMKEHIFGDDGEEDSEHEEALVSIELESAEFLALIRMILREEKSRLSEDDFSRVQSRAIHSAVRSVKFVETENNASSRSLNDWIRHFIKFHNPDIVHDEY